MRVEFEETSLTVSESQESVEICVNSTSPGIEEEFAVNIISDIEGCTLSIFICQIITFNYYGIGFTGFFRSFHQFEIVVNSSSLSDFQCYNQSYGFTSGDICTYFTERNDVHIMLTLTPADRNSLVVLTKDSLEIVIKVPSQCSCSEALSSSSLGDAEIAAILLGILIAMTLLATIAVLVFFFFRERRKKS